MKAERLAGREMIPSCSVSRFTVLFRAAIHSTTTTASKGVRYISKERKEEIHLGPSPASKKITTRARAFESSLSCVSNHSKSRMLTGGRRRHSFKASRGPGVKHAAWVNQSYDELAVDFR